MEGIRHRIDEAANAIRDRAKLSPRVGIVLGTGLGKLAEGICEPTWIDYADIPHFPQSTAPGHEGQLVLGTIGDCPVAAMQGRFHFYEGYSMAEITFPIRVFKALGAGTVILTTAAGGMNPQFRSGELMVITDHINLMGANPLIGPNDDGLGPRFPDMAEPYSSELIEIAEGEALEMGLRVHRGVYVAVTGPNLETRAEYRFLRTIGADAVGMSTVPEVLVAVHSGLQVLAFAAITDECFPDALKPVDIEKIFRVAGELEPQLTELVTRVLNRI